MPNGYHGSKESKKWEEMEKPLLEIDEALENFARQHGMTIRKNYHDTVERGLQWNSDEFDRLIQISPEENSSFDFWVAVTFDENNERYWKNEFLKKSVPWEEIKTNLEQLLDDGFRLAESWGREDLQPVGDSGGQTFWQAIRNLFRSRQK